MELYRQGRINLALNSEQDSAAAEHFQMHGPAVCAMGLRVDDVAQAPPCARMDSFVLFYRALFGLQPEPLWELPDPYGLILSRTMVSSGRSARACR